MTKDTETSSISRDDVGSLRSLLGVDEETELKEFKPCVFFKTVSWLAHYIIGGRSYSFTDIRK